MGVCQGRDEATRKVIELGGEPQTLEGGQQ